MKLRTKFRLTLVVIALVFIAVPYVVGRVAEWRYQQLVSAFNAQYGDSVTTERYERGMFSSRVDTRVNLERLLARIAPGIPASELAPLTACVMRVRSNVRHGLFAWPRLAPQQPLGPLVAASKDVVTISLPPQLSREPLTFTTHTVLNLDRTVETLLTVPPGDHVVAGTIMLTCSSEINGVARFDEQLTRVMTALTIPHVKILSETMRAELYGAMGSFSTRQKAPDQAPTHASLQIASLAITPNDEPGVFLTNLHFVSGTAHSNALLTVTSSMTVDKIEAAGETYGPITIQTALRNIDARALARVQTLVKNAQQNIASGANPTAAMGLMMASLPDILNQFLQASPAIDFQQWSARTPYGEFTVRGTLAASTGMPITAFSFLDIQGLWRLLNADLTVTLPAMFVETVIQPNADDLPLDLSTLLIKSNAHYRSHVTFSNAVLTVNGTVVPLPGGTK